MTRRTVLLIGGCHRDVVARVDARFEPGSSCPGRVRETAGGVARNVAVLLASAGLDVAIVSRVGADAAGDGLLATLAAAGVDTGSVVRDAAVATGSYIAVHDEAGELVAAVSDLSVYDAMSPAVVEEAAPRMASAPLVFADANLPVETLDELARRFGPRLVVDAISRAKAPRVLSALRAGALGFLNLPSAAALAGSGDADPRLAAAALAGLGVTRAVVTGGRRDVAVLEEGRVHAVPVPSVSVVDVTGAGDALTAGTLAALLAGRPLAAAVAVGVRAAGAALSREGALDRLPPDVVEAATRGEDPT